MKLSIIIPAYNEEKTLELIFNKVFTAFSTLIDQNQLEVVMVNDCSKDSTKQIIEKLKLKYNFIVHIDNEKNLGKSQSVRSGILRSKGEYIVIQDADLEYEPSDIYEMLRVAYDQNMDVVYGNRFGKKNKVIYWHNYIGNLALSAFSNLFTFPRIKVWITDMEVCYKLIKGDIARDVAKSIISKSNFGFEPEVTAKLSKYKLDNRNLHFYVVPIYYYPRTVAEGKKIHFLKDGIKALVEIIRFNLF